MSYTFYVKSSARPDFARLLPALNAPDLKCCEGELPKQGRWPEEAILNFYRDRISAQPIEIQYEDGIFKVHVRPLSAPEDYEMAFRFVELFAAPGGTVESEEGNRFPASELRRKFDAAWIAAQNHSAAQSLAQGVAEDQVAEIQGPVRSYFFGPRVFRELAEAGPAEQFAERLLEAIRAAQYVDPEVYFPAELMEAESEDSEESFTCAVWGPNAAYLFPAAEFLVLVVNEMQDDTLMVPRSVLPRIAPGKWKWLDEEQALVQAIPSEEWPAFIARAREFEVKPRKG